MNKARFTAPSAVIIGEPEIGEGTWCGHFCILDASEGLTIGKDCSIASGVHIYSHSTHLLTATLGERKTGKIVIGDHVAVGANTIIHYGCTIKDNSIIGALSQLRPHTTVGSYEYWAGNPARFIRTLRHENLNNI